MDDSLDPFTLTKSEEAIIRLGGRLCGEVIKNPITVHDEVTFMLCGEVVQVCSPNVAYCPKHRQPLLYRKTLDRSAFTNEEAEARLRSWADQEYTTLLLKQKDFEK